MQNWPVIVGKNIRRFREERGLTQEELADRSGLSARYIGAIERAEMSASVTVCSVRSSIRANSCG